MALPNSARNILESKIHQSFTVAADELLKRGYLNRETRIALSKVIGDVLDNFGVQADMLVGNLTIQPSDVEAIANKSAKEGFSVFKDDSGKWRWVLFSSNAYRDRDREIVSQKALENDVDRADRDRDFGPLRWWHVPGLDVGQCDFNMLHGTVLIESGTFDNPRVAQAVKEHAHELQVSVGFRHPLSEPDRNGVYWQIHRFERSLLPVGRASNFLTAIPNVKKEVRMDIAEKIKAFYEVVGDKTLADGILGQSKKLQATAKELGIEYKEYLELDSFRVEEKSDGRLGLTIRVKCGDNSTKMKPKRKKVSRGV